MPMSLRSFTDQARSAERTAQQGALSVEQAAAQLREAQEQADADARAATAAAKVAAKERVAAERQAKADVGTLEETVSSALGAAQAAVSAVAPPWLRQACRSWLRGTLASPGELMPSETIIVNGDPATGILLNAHKAAAQLTERLADDGMGHLEVYRDADRLEVRAWGAFVGRIRSLAGE